MSKNSPQELASARLMLAGIKANQTRLIRRGIDEQFIEDFETAINEASALEAEQEALMARRKEKTAALQDKLDVVARMNATGKKLVKLDYPKESWREFGITDKQ